MVAMPQLSFLIFLSTLLLSALPSTSANEDHASSILKRYISGRSTADVQYVAKMCFPLMLDETRARTLGLTLDTLIPSLANSPFPCEQVLYIGNTCFSNGTTAIDFLAEQQCLCGGSWFDADVGCNYCAIAHGLQGYTPAQIVSSASSLSSAECATSPPRGPFTNLAPALDVYATLNAGNSLTFGSDLYPNKTAVSNYFTATASMTPGQITGEATKRLQTFTNVGNVRFTGMPTPSNAAASRDVHAAGGLLVAVVAAVMAL